MYSLAGRYDNPISTRFLALIDCLKIPAQRREHSVGRVQKKKEEKSGLRVEEGRADRLRGLREEGREERAQRSRAKRAEVSGLEGERAEKGEKRGLLEERAEKRGRI
jgi:hypothetical protein